MSHSSKRSGRPTVVRDAATYAPKVRQYERLLNSAGKSWDEGNSEQVVAMVTALRVLLIDRLLDKVVRMDRTRFFDTSLPAMPGASIASGLTVIAIGGAAGSGIRPLCQMQIPEGLHPTRRFSDWWERDTVVRHGSLRWTRKFLVYEMANTDSMHVDSELDADYSILSGPVPNITFGYPDGSRSPADGTAEASVRQIAWEVSRTLRSLDLSEG